MKKYIVIIIIKVYTFTQISFKPLLCCGHFGEQPQNDLWPQTCNSNPCRFYFENVLPIHGNINACLKDILFLHVKELTIKALCQTHLRLIWEAHWLGHPKRRRKKSVHGPPIIIFAWERQKKQTVMKCNGPLSHGTIYFHSHKS